MNLNSLHIQNFRMLEDFKVEKLGHLNLIVGKNNSGKSTVLEALRIFASNADYSLLTDIASDRDEKYFSGDADDGDQDGMLPFESFFTGRCFPDDEEKAIVIGEGGDSPESLRLQHVYLVKIDETIKTESGETTIRGISKFIAKSELSKVNNENISRAVKISKNDMQFLIPLDESYRRKRLSPSFENQKILPCGYVSTRFVSQNRLADRWDKIVLTENEQRIITALQFIDGSVESISFVRDDNDDDPRPISMPRRSFNRIAKVKLNNIKQPVPLKSMGDGMLRVLQLALNVFSAKRGFLLIDEFENGLHFSVQEKVWQWLFDLAKSLDIQVFATTHSWDCVESFSKVATQRSDVDGVLFRVGRSVRTSDNGRIIATEFDENALANITQNDVEVR